MTTYVLIAGAWHGSWCWSEVAPRLEASGHRVLTPDLLGMDEGGAAAIAAPLALWADQIADLVRREADPVVLVGHSRAGLIISEVAERVPEKVDLLVYVCAFLLRDGQTLQEIAQQADNSAVFASAMDVHGDGTASVRQDALTTLFYNETPDHFVEIAQRRLRPEPLAAFATPVHVTDRRFGTVPRAYVECLRDGAIPIATQRMMQDALPCARSARLDTDHSPFFSAPDALVTAIEELSTSE